MNKKEMDNMAYDIASFWSTNCFDEDFYDNCMNDICERLDVDSGVITDEAYEVWNIIEDKYLDI